MNPRASTDGDTRPRGLAGRSRFPTAGLGMALLAMLGCQGGGAPSLTGEAGKATPATVSRVLRVVPSAAVLSPFEKSQPPPEITLRVTSPSGRPFRILRVRDPEGDLRANAAPEGGGWMIRVVATRPPRGNQGTLEVETDLPEEPRFLIPWVVSDPTTWPVRARKRQMTPAAPSGP